ncbi:hypothetical protein [Candidatus Midichloria mitochondrii]|nr:hypothetical protein [Candidatus Midichloria mitochondrii]
MPKTSSFTFDNDVHKDEVVVVGVVATVVEEVGCCSGCVRR